MMKRKICILTGALMLAAVPAPANALEWEFRDIPHTFTAKLGEAGFLLDGEEIPLPGGAVIYRKDGYVMLPAEPLLQALSPDVRVFPGNTETEFACTMGYSLIIFNLEDNTVYVSGEKQELSGSMENRDGQVYVPLRGWKDILTAYGYGIGDGDITWDGKTQTATMRITEEKLVIEGEEEKPSAAKGEGAAPVYAIPLTQEYDEIENLGGGFFHAQGYAEKNVELGTFIGSPDNSHALLDSTGKERKAYKSGSDIVDVTRIKNRGFLVECRNGAQNMVIDEDGKILSRMPQEWDIGYGQRYGRPIEDLILVEKREGIGSGFMDTEGKLVLDTSKYHAVQPFSEGLAAVSSGAGWGYIDKKGKEVIKSTSYAWASDFYNGKAFVTEKETKDVWLIDKSGKKLKQIGNGLSEYRRGRQPFRGILLSEDVVEYPHGQNHTHIISLYDETGEIPYAKLQWARESAEGLMAFYDKKTKKYGYVDEDWNWVIAPAFDSAGDFIDGYAVVCMKAPGKKGGEDVDWGVIKKP